MKQGNGIWRGLVLGVWWSVWLEDGMKVRRGGKGEKESLHSVCGALGDVSYIALLALSGV